MFWDRVAWAYDIFAEGINRKADRALCAAVERLGIGVALTQGSYLNLKITTPEDLAIGEALLDWRETP